MVRQAPRQRPEGLAPAGSRTDPAFPQRRSLPRLRLTPYADAVPACPDHGRLRIALLAVLIFPDRVQSVIAIHAPLPANLADMPFEERPLAGLPVLLAGMGTETSARRLAEHGERVTTTPSAPQGRLIAKFLGVPA